MSARETFLSSIYGLQSHRFLMSLAYEEAQDGCNDRLPAVRYSFQADNRNKVPKKCFLLQTDIAIDDMPTSLTFERVMRDCLYGVADFLQGKDEAQKQKHYERLANILCMERSLHIMLYSSIPRYELRMVGGIEELHGFRNALVLLVDSLDRLQSLSQSYSSSFRGHKDRVLRVLPVPLYAFLLPSWEEFAAFVHELLGPTQEKVHIHFHVQQICWTGVSSLWRDDGQSTNTFERLYSLNNLARSEAARGLGVLLTVESCARRLVLDVPGGKRNLGETSLECAMRETWEETGLDLRGAAVRPMWTPPGASCWSIVSHHVLHQMACFVCYGTRLLTALPTIYSSAVRSEEIEGGELQASQEVQFEKDED